MNTFSQSEINQLLKDKSQLEKIAQLNQLAWTIRNLDEKQSRVLAETAYALLRESPSDNPVALKQLAKCLTTLAYLNHYQTANFELSLSQSLEAVALFEQINDSAGLPPGLNIAGLSHVRLGDPSEAMAYHLRALEICKEFNDKVNEAEVYNHMAIVYTNWGQHQQALTYFDKSLALHQEVGNQFGQAVTLLNRCMIYKDLGRYQDSLVSGLRSLHLLEELQVEWPMTMALCNVANTYLALNQTQQAFHYFNRALALVEQIDDKFTQVYILLNVARAHYDLNDYEKSEDYLNRGLTLAEASKQKGVQFECHELLTKIFKAQNNFEKALAHHEKFHQLNRALFNEQSDRRLKNLEIRHRIELAQKEALFYQSKNIKLEQEIAERIKLENTLQKTNLQLSELNASKDRLFSIIAHDLRGPFSPLLRLAELLAEASENIEIATVKEASRSIYRSANNIYNLLENLLEWSRIQLSYLKHRPIRLNLYEIGEKNIELFTSIAQEKEITLQNDIEPDLMVWADRYMLDTIIRNLMSNALKFTYTGGLVTVKARHLSTDTEPHYVEVAVSDTGVGLSRQNLEKLFKVEEPYQTIGTAHEKGTGLGLIICKELVEKNKGQLSVTSQVGQGTTFKFTVPA